MARSKGVCNSGGGCESFGCGTVFSITPGGTEPVLHSFGKCSDGAGPVASLINVKGTLYGTTVGGGAYTVGTVFSITLDGKERVLYSFLNNGEDAAQPYASLINIKGALYGTTYAGGAYGDGTAFSITP